MNNVNWIRGTVGQKNGPPHCSFFIIHCTLIFLLSGCLSSKEYLLTSQTIRGNRTISSEALESLIPQKPNRRVLGLPITPPLWFYQLGLRRYNREAALKNLQDKTNEFEQQSQQLANDPKALKALNRRYSRQLKRLRQKAEEGNWLMRSLGEPPSYFVEANAKANAIKMQKYLSDKGFFNAQTRYTLDTLRRRQIRVNYLIKENAGFYLRNITYQIADPRVDSIVRQSFDQSRLHVGDRFDFDNMSGERLRIESLLRDQGYYAFSRQYIRATDVDTIRRGHDRRFFQGLEPGDSTRRSVDIALQIANPPGQSAHPIYHIGAVEMHISSSEATPNGAPAAGTIADHDTLRRNGISYLLGERDISLRLLNSKILFRPNQLYSQTNYRDTQRQLFLLNQFKFVNINFIDTTNRRLHTLITATPLDKYEATAEGGVTGLLYQGQGYPGGFGSLIFRVRNMFGGLETFETSVRFGLEAQTGFVPDPSKPDQSVYTSQELGISSSLIFPQILFPGGIRFRFNRYAPRTQVSLSFNNTFRPDFQRSLLRATMAYNWQTTSYKQFSFFIADINLINAGDGTNRVISDAFKVQLDSLTAQGSTVYLNFFRRSLSSSFSFAYTHNTNIPGQNRRANFLRTVFESGGTTLNLFSNQKVDAWSQENGGIGLQLYKFIRTNIDYRYYMPVRNRATLAFRVNTGMVFGYGPNNQVPYEKFFFAGGSNSVRAWLPRRLGPGAAFPSEAGHPDKPAQTSTGQFVYLFEQPGNILFEASAELRGRLFHLGADVNGALFIDAGNVWRLSNNSSRPGSVFQFDTFIPQIAVGTGVGLRFDFSFFVIRFDGGIKVWDPVRKYVDSEKGLVNNRFILPEFSLSKLSKGPNPLVINFGIGYPF
ncbi:BamA/TamA family outer membrane protein [Spirosoma sp. KNUC1025]|uniref:translocation and assembly module lipoprotein TamL n=1 Tax=Spirosoma sp. KNUC1025 TaxID=2894082 RepID=UPI00386E8B24|nr:outer membrane protein assembly factor [Spirosoma sp. KNUC1025]